MFQSKLSVFIYICVHVWYHSASNCIAGGGLINAGVFIVAGGSTRFVYYILCLIIIITQKCHKHKLQGNHGNIQVSVVLEKLRCMHFNN